MSRSFAAADDAEGRRALRAHIRAREKAREEAKEHERHVREVVSAPKAATTTRRGDEYLPPPDAELRYDGRKCACENTGWHEPGRCGNFVQIGERVCWTCSMGRV